MRSQSIPDREIPQRDLRNQPGKILREVAAGKHLRVLMGGKAMADLVPISEAKSLVSRSEVEAIIEQAPLDSQFSKDVGNVLSATIDEL